jgi:hypothetical protein
MAEKKIIKPKAIKEVVKQAEKSAAVDPIVELDELVESTEAAETHDEPKLAKAGKKSAKSLKEKEGQNQARAL